MLPVKEGYPCKLPNGIKAGTLARLISFDHGYWTVEAKGRTFKVFLTQVDPAGFTNSMGAGLDETDPGVIAMEGAASMRSSLAFSSVNGGCVNPPLPVKFASPFDDKLLNA